MLPSVDAYRGRLKECFTSAAIIIVEEVAGVSEHEERQDHNG